MEYEKRVLILKQTENHCSLKNKPLSAICRIEKEYGVSTLHLTTLNCTPTDGEYYLFVVDSNACLHAFNLGKDTRASGLYFNKEPSTDKGVAVGICTVRDDIPITVAFAREQSFNYTKEQFKKAVAEYFLEVKKNKNRKKTELKPTPTPTLESAPKSLYEKPDITQQENLSPKDETPQNQYDDEAVATENYFDKEQEFIFDERLKTFEEIDCGNLQFENDLPFNESKTETIKNSQGSYSVQDETDGNKRKTTKTNKSYYQTVKKELTALFNKFPTEDALEKIFCESSFVKINYSSDKFYVVGLIKEDHLEKYICYGVPGKYSPEPPKELKGCCTFIPLSIFNICGDGYWMMFQDALTGKCITPITA